MAVQHTRLGGMQWALMRNNRGREMSKKRREEWTGAE